MTLAELQTLLDYHYWARDRVLSAVERLSPEQYTRPLGSSFPSIRDTLLHLYSAEWVWHSRWEGVSPTAHLAPADFPDVTSLRAAWVDTEEKVRAFVVRMGAEPAGLERVFAYAALNGQPAASVFQDMVQHVVNHGSYHRGQVTTLLRQLGAVPAPSLDLIAYYRERRPVNPA